MKRPILDSSVAHDYSHSAAFEAVLLRPPPILAYGLVILLVVFAVAIGLWFHLGKMDRLIFFENKASSVPALNTTQSLPRPADQI